MDGGTQAASVVSVPAFYFRRLSAHDQILMYVGW